MENYRERCGAVGDWGGPCPTLPGPGPSPGSRSRTQGGLASRRPLGELRGPRLCERQADSGGPGGLCPPVARPAVLDLHFPAAGRSGPSGDGSTALPPYKVAWWQRVGSPERLPQHPGDQQRRPKAPPKGLKALAGPAGAGRGGPCCGQGRTRRAAGPGGEGVSVLPGVLGGARAARGGVLGPRRRRRLPPVAQHGDKGRPPGAAGGDLPHRPPPTSIGRSQEKPRGRPGSLPCSRGRSAAAAGWVPALVYCGCALRREGGQGGGWYSARRALCLTG